MKSCHGRLCKRAAERRLAGMPTPRPSELKKTKQSPWELMLSSQFSDITALVRFWAADVELFAALRVSYRRT